MLALVVFVGVTVVEPKKADAPEALIAVQTCDGDTIQLNRDEKRILDLYNQAPTSREKKALCVHPDLTEAARAHSQDMLDRDYSSHTSPEGETVKQRLGRFGYTFRGYSHYRYGETSPWALATLTLIRTTSSTGG